MTRLVTFADGFTSVAPTEVQVGEQQKIILQNNMGAFFNVDDFILDPEISTTWFIEYEVDRRHKNPGPDFEIFKQSGNFILIYLNGAWEIRYGNYVPELNMIQEMDVVNPQDVAFNINGANEFQYKTGNMVGDEYEGTAILSITRIIR